MAVYYIASASSGGSTGNTGLSIASPWPLSKLNTFEVAGDIILINKGDTLTGTSTISRSGTSGNPITYDVYGSATNNPILDGGSSTTNKTLTITGHFIVVKNIQVQNSFTTAFGTLFLSGTGCHDVAIRNCHVTGGYRGIHAQNCTDNIIIDSCYIEGVGHNAGGTAGPASGDGAHIQLDNCNGAGIQITNNKVYVASPNVGVGDLISMFQSSGTIGSYIQISGNILYGGGNGTNGYDGIGVGDVGGAYQHCFNNRLSETGYAGIQIPGGDSIIVEGNYIYSSKRTFPGGTGSLKAMTCYSAFGATPTNITAQNNFLNWKDYNGNVNNLYVDTAHVATPAGWGTNTPNSVQDTLAPSTIVANPPFLPGDWNQVAVPVPNYSPTGYTLVNGVAISTIGNTGSTYYPITFYSISPALPAGLSFNTTTGQITGTPTVNSVNTTYTITANSIGGSGTDTINIQVVTSVTVTKFFRPIKFL